MKWPIRNVYVPMETHNQKVMCDSEVSHDSPALSFALNDLNARLEAVEKLAEKQCTCGNNRERELDALNEQIDFEGPSKEDVEASCAAIERDAKVAVLEKVQEEYVRSGRCITYSDIIKAKLAALRGGSSE